MLPSVPKSFGRLSEAYLSAFLAVQGKPSLLEMPPRKSYAVILIDGLGVANIKAAGAHAGFLNSRLATSRSLFSGFPTTTATSLASFATGKTNGEHGFIGYRVYDRQLARPINLLNDLGRELSPTKYLASKTISELAVEAGIDAVTIGPGEYSESGFTQATMPASRYLVAKTIQERFTQATRELSKPGTLVYLYVPELDQLAHRFGSSSSKWLSAIEDLDSIVAKFASSLPKDAGAILTADHGVIDVSRSEHIYLDEYSSTSDLAMIGGDPRVGFLYFSTEVDVESKRLEIKQQLDSRLEVLTMDELVLAGWISPLATQAKNIAPDLVLVPKGNSVLYHRDFAKTKSLEMVGQHGGMSKAEWEVPLIVF